MEWPVKKKCQQLYFLVNQKEDVKGIGFAMHFIFYVPGTVKGSSPQVFPSFNEKEIEFHFAK